MVIGWPDFAHQIQQNIHKHIRFMLVGGRNRSINQIYAYIK